MLFGLFERSTFGKRGAQMPMSLRGIRIEHECGAEFADRRIELTARCVRYPELVVNVGRFWNDRAEVLAAGDDASAFGELARAHTLSRSRSIRFAQEPEIQIKACYYRDRHPVVETLRTPGGHSVEIDDGRGHEFTEIQQRSHTVFLHWPVVCHRHHVSCRLRQLLRVAQEHTHNLARGAETQTCEIGAYSRALRHRGKQLVRIDLDSIVGADQN